jgi:fumarate hydratase class II
MSICKKGFAAIRTFYDHVTPELEGIVNDVVTVTGKIKDIANNPAVATIASLIPGGTAVETGLNAAANVILGVGTEIQDLPNKITQLATGTTAQVNANLIKLASTAVKSIDTVADPIKTEVFYDTLVQNTVLTHTIKS